MEAIPAVTVVFGTIATVVEITGGLVGPTASKFNHYNYCDVIYRSFDMPCS